jgi:hypothetical protein
LKVLPYDTDCSFDTDSFTNTEFYLSVLRLFAFEGSFYGARETGSSNRLLCDLCVSFAFSA